MSFHVRITESKSSQSCETPNPWVGDFDFSSQCMSIPNHCNFLSFLYCLMWPPSESEMAQGVSIRWKTPEERVQVFPASRLHSQADHEPQKTPGTQQRANGESFPFHTGHCNTISLCTFLRENCRCSIRLVTDFTW